MKFLLITDDQPLAVSLKGALEERGHLVSVQKIKSLGNKRLLADNPEVLILDWAEMDARLQRSYRRLRQRDKVTVAMLLSGKGADEGEEADVYLVKPVAVDRLLRHCEMARSDAPERLHCGDLVLDLPSCRLVRGDEAEALTPKQSKLLAVLMQNTGEVLSRKVLMTKVWDTDYLGDTRTLDVHICWLRKKMEEGLGTPQLLRTVRGVGYCFAGEAI